MNLSRGLAESILPDRIGFREKALACQYANNHCNGSRDTWEAHIFFIHT